MLARREARAGSGMVTTREPAPGKVLQLKGRKMMLTYSDIVAFIRHQRV